MQTIPLKYLTVSDAHNVRKTHRAEGLDQLKASIQAHGLQQNLVVMEGNEEGRYEVIAGGRRLAALQAMQREGVLPDDYPVPCRLAEERDADEISLAENTVRVAMHPADQFEAWAKLVDGGLTIADIAARFGVTETLVRQRLKLARISPQLMQAYREDALTLEALMAFALTDDHERQEELFDRVRDSWEIHNASAIRRALTETMVASDHRFARFVGVDEYQQAGGTLRCDLFSEDGESYLEDIPLLERLVDEKLQRKAEEVKGQWNWAEFRRDFGYEEHAAFSEVHPRQLRAVPDELLQERNALAESLEALGEPGDEAYQEAEEALQRAEDEIASCYGYTDEDKAVAGCVITVDHGGGLCVMEGLVRPEDRKAATRSGSAPERGAAVHDTSPRYNRALTESLEHYRLYPVRQAMARDFDAAFDAAVYVMCVAHFSQHGQGERWLQLDARSYACPYRLSREDSNLAAFQEQEATLFGKLPFAWLNEAEDVERFQAFCRLTPQQKQSLFAACVAKCLTPQLSTSHAASAVFEAICQRLDVDVAQHWRPTAENFLSRVTRSELNAIGEQTLRPSWIDKHRKMKKQKLVEILHEAFQSSGDTRRTETQRAALAAWLPEGMACNGNPSATAA